MLNLEGGAYAFRSFQTNLTGMTVCDCATAFRTPSASAGSTSRLTKGGLRGVGAVARAPALDRRCRIAHTDIDFGRGIGQRRCIAGAVPVLPRMSGYGPHATCLCFTGHLAALPRLRYSSSINRSVSPA